MDSKSIFEKIYKEFSIPLINPNDTIDICAGNINTHLYGIVWIETQIKPNNASQQKITTYQKNGDTDEYIYPQLNMWGDSSFIQSGAETESSLTNFLILLLTFLLFLETILGLKNIANFSLNLIGRIFIEIGNLIIN